LPTALAKHRKGQSLAEIANIAFSRFPAKPLKVGWVNALDRTTVGKSKPKSLEHVTGLMLDGIHLAGAVVGTAPQDALNIIHDAYEQRKQLLHVAFSKCHRIPKGSRLRNGHPLRMRDFLVSNAADVDQ
jgi:hypothetical protein